MEELFITLRKASYVFGGQEGRVSDNLTTLHNMEQEGFLTYEGITQLSSTIPGLLRALAHHTGSTPGDTAELLKARAIPCSAGFNMLNETILKRYPAIAEVELPPSGADWDLATSVKDKLEWLGRAIEWMQR